MVADDRRMREGPAAWISAVVGVLAFVAAVIFGVLTLNDDEDGGDPPAPAPTTIAMPTPTSNPPPVEKSTEPAPEPTTSPPTTQPPKPTSGWPVDADDGSPAMYAYFGSEFMFPDWVACETTYCIVGSGGDVHVYRQKPIKRLATVAASAADPAAALVDTGLSATQARALLGR